MKPGDRVRDWKTKAIGIIVADERGDCTEREVLVVFPGEEYPLRLGKIELEIIREVPQ